MKNVFTCLFVACVLTAFGQLQPATNLTELSQVRYSTPGNDIWGYVAPDSTEYAIMGLQSSTSIVSLADPTNAVVVATVPGPASTWRDIKTWGHYAYVCHDRVDDYGAGVGVAIIDLSSLPDSVTHTEFQPEYQGGILEIIHNLYIDEFGYLYVAGSNLNSGGILIYDLNQDPVNPPLAGAAVDTYAHDVYTRDNMMYTSDIWNGSFAVHDVSDKSNITVLAAQPTSFFFTHNAWLSDDSNTLFTTDELENAYTGAYDISDLDDIKELDLFRPLATEGRGVVPHNAHVLNDFLVISHYTDGIIIVDGNKPDNLIEVANYDTYAGPDGRTNGCWGAYPFLPSGLVLASTRDGGAGGGGILTILEPTYVRAAYLEGKITDAATGDVISGAKLDFTTVAARATTDLSGDYKMGYSTAGAYEVTVQHQAYIEKTVSVSIANGEITVLDIEMDARPTYKFSSQVVSADDNMPIENAVVSIVNDNIGYEVVTDNSGNFDLEVIGDTYQVAAGKWGYLTKIAEQDISSTTSTTIALERGVRDDFVLDLGWTVSGNAPRGIWERGEPVGTANGFVNPDVDLPDDVGDQCYVTGNGGGGVGLDDVDNGTTILTSPTTDMTNMEHPTVSYNTWFVTASGQGPLDDTLKIKLTDGNTTVVVEEIAEPLSEWRPTSVVYVKSYFQNPTASMQIIFEVSDQVSSNSGHLVEAAVDRVEVYEGDPIGIQDVIDRTIKMTAFPNPFDTELRIDYVLEDLNDRTILEVHNSLGQIVYQTNITDKQGTHTIQKELNAGIYFVQINTGTSISVPLKVVCTE